VHQVRTNEIRVVVVASPARGLPSCEVSISRTSRVAAQMSCLLEDARDLLVAPAATRLQFPHTQHLAAVDLLRLSPCSKPWMCW